MCLKIPRHAVLKFCFSIYNCVWKCNKPKYTPPVTDLKTTSYTLTFFNTTEGLRAIQCTSPTLNGALGRCIPVLSNNDSFIKFAIMDTFLIKVPENKTIIELSLKSQMLVASLVRLKRQTPTVSRLG